MVSSAEQIRQWRGPAILSYGYRPFFLFGALSAAVSMVIWILILSGFEVLPLAMDPISWHAHSFLFSYVWAIVAGFLMTAVPNWTGRFPIVGWPLLALVLLWFVSWFAIGFSAWLPYWLVIVLDLIFPIALIINIGREIIFGKNWRNLKMLANVGFIILANLIFDYEALYLGSASDGFGARLGICFIILLITLVGGRVVPSFTRNWLARQGASNLPVPFNREDKIITVITTFVLVLWVILPDSTGVGFLALIAGMANLRRLYRWRGFSTLGDPLVTVLHVGFLFVPLGFLAIGINDILGLPGGRAPVQHFWMAGAIGLMTMAIMTRASLGHSGRALKIGWPVVGIYFFVIFSIVLRVIAGFYDNTETLLYPAAALWILGFLGFVVLYWNILTKPRISKV